MLIFLDLETSGLRPEKHVILEVGVVLTQDDLTIQDQESWVVKQSINLDEIDPNVVRMHTKNGLWVDVDQKGLPQGTVEADVIAWLDARVNWRSAWTMAGNSIHFDRSFLRRHMPELDDRFHYRLVDVSSFKEMMQRWLPKKFNDRPIRRSTHRAVPDCLGSIEELSYYRDIILGAQGSNTTV